MSGRALVLGGGGVTGVAWELGLLAGLAEAGVDLGTADLIVGTSAGSVVAAQLGSGIGVEDPYARQLEARSGELAARFGTRTVARLVWASLGARDPRSFRARVGRMALGARTVAPEERRAVIETRLPVHTWPERKLLITAVDAESGELVTYGPDSGVELVDAVAASCAVPGVWPPARIGDRRLIDGGVRSPANADLATGYPRVVVVAPITRGLRPMGRLSDQVARLKQEGASVVVVTPDKAARQAIGRNVLDPARRPASARAGRAQAASAVADVAPVWVD